MATARHPRIPVLVVVTGPPGAGKTSIARSLAETLDLPLVEKDTLKEIIGGELGITDRERSLQLGAAVFELMAALVHDLLRHGVSVVAEGNFTPASRLVTELPACRVAQVHVTAAPEVLRDRLRARKRHPVHYDAEAADEIAERARRGDWAALPLEGELIEVDTSSAFPDVASIAARSVFA